jgi:hypothetical protein
MAGAVNAAGRCKISRFITYNRAVCSVTMRRKISLPYAIVATNGRIFIAQFTNNKEMARKAYRLIKAHSPAQWAPLPAERLRELPSSGALPW